MRTAARVGLTILGGIGGLIFSPFVSAYALYHFRRIFLAGVEENRPTISRIASAVASFFLGLIMPLVGLYYGAQIAWYATETAEQRAARGRELREMAEALVNPRAFSVADDIAAREVAARLYCQPRGGFSKPLSSSYDAASAAKPVLPAQDEQTRDRSPSPGGKK